MIKKKAEKKPIKKVIKKSVKKVIKKKIKTHPYFICFIHKKGIASCVVRTEYTAGTVIGYKRLQLELVEIFPNYKNITILNFFELKG